MNIIHHGAVNGVTGSCHQLNINDKTSVLIDCGLFQGDEKASSAGGNSLEIQFDISNVSALIVTHCHIDHVGRIPYLLAAGFKGPIFCTTATASLLPMVIEDALKVGVTRNSQMINAFLKLLKRQIVAVDYKKWFELPVISSENDIDSFKTAKAKFQVAGHILGSAYVEIELGKRPNNHRVVFSGDLGAPYAPLLPAPKAPYRADTLVIESTYGDKNHAKRKERSKQLKQLIDKAVSDNGVVLIPAFSIGRTQELLYELEQIIYAQRNVSSVWQSIEVIVDSPMAANFTELYLKFKDLWDKEARRKVHSGRHPLDFNQLYTVDSHQQHMQTIEYLAKRNKPAIIIAASGMCAGGRIVNYLEAFLPDKTADVIFVGYQAKGSPGRDIQKYGPRGGYVFLNHEKIKINAGVHTISGYSAHADQAGLINFVKRMRHKPQHIRIVHGDDYAKKALQSEYINLLPDCDVVIG
ncbi:MBL fold metallo-hydrolase RNA specificity domain-containing protein [Pseudoalteromonas denitrificans]|uniref:Metallo-beta-lactamase family protein n=1 Tax=Pseudoalteromonas denitrificans DSM 6059 TaxID=1123010 RepID=A0A1I1TSU4_9GAMM|nr:MBL fold metallo-hydrolase [Pseudoalteromonas denitrificans]SFD61677.1 metallo-beta-lactamase family protein [Pseudoalteromonas denitrificans DSM 6059]